MKQRILHTHIDCRETKITMAEMFRRALEIQNLYPDREVFFDGDLYSLVSAEYVEIPDKVGELGVEVAE